MSHKETQHMDGQHVFRWLLDVQDLWPGPDEKNETTLSTARWALGEDTQYALSLLQPAEKAKVLRYFRPSDAKLSLASNLLKRRAVVNTCGVSWHEAIISEDNHRKPCYRPSGSQKSRIEFNTSHHGTLVSLVGCTGEFQLGTDIAQVNWEKDFRSVQKEGFEAWANIYEAVFSDREVADIVEYCPPGNCNWEEQIRAKLRHFYAHWALKEAFVKMTGEALMAPWLKDLEFRNVQVPQPSGQMQPEFRRGDWGQICGNVEIWFNGVEKSNVKMELQAFGEDYMIATAATNAGATFLPFEELDVKLNVYS